MARTFRLLALALAVSAAFVAAGFGFLQTRPGKDWLAAEIARLASTPDRSWAIEGLGGSVPFAMTARRIEVGDAEGVWLTLRDVRLDLDPAGLLAGRLHVRLARAVEIDQARPPAGPSKTLAELLHVPHLPMALVVDRLVIDRLALAAPVLGESIVATVAGNVAAGGAAARAALDLHRIDASPGSIALQMTLAGAAPTLALHLQADEPTGLLLADALGRNDRLPAALTIDGNGPVADWHGRLTATAGRQARLDADVALGVSTETVLGLAAHADMAPLLPANLAPLVGDQASLALHATFGRQIALDRLSFATASGSVAGNASLDRAGGSIGAHLRADLPDLSKLAGITGGEPSGAAAMTVELSGDELHPVAKADLTASGVAISGSGAEEVEAHFSATPTGALGDPQTRIAVDGNGEVGGLALPEGGSLARQLGRKIGWSFAALVDRDARAIKLGRFAVQDSGLDLHGSGHLAFAAHGVAGAVDLIGTASGLRTGIAVADALLGATPAVTGTIARDDAGTVALSHLTLTGAAAKLTGGAQFDPDLRGVNAALTIAVPRLEALRPALKTDVAGAVSGEVTAQGPLDRLRLQAKVDGRGIAAGGAILDRAQLSGVVADLSQPKAAITGNFRAGSLDGNLALNAAPIGKTGIALSGLRLTAAAATIAGDLRIAFAGGLAEGALRGHVPDLSRWSRLAGRPLRGSLDIAAGLAQRGGGQGLDLTLDGTRLAVGAPASRTEIGRLAITARLADLWRLPSGTGRLALNGANVAAFDFTNATATFASARPGRFAFQGNADGRPLRVAFAGDVGFSAGGAAFRLARLTGSLGDEPFALDEPVELSRRGADFALSRLALRLGTGRVTAGGAVRGGTLSFTLNAAKLPLAAAARLAGDPELHGDLSAAASFGGTLRAPHGHLVLDAAGLSLAVSRQATTPRLGLTVEGDWSGRAVDFKGQVTGLHGDRMAFTGSLPLLWSAAPVGISIPPQGRLAASLKGAGEIGRLADLLPLGEDRLSGKFAAELSVGGTVAAPVASGRLMLSDGRYENFASGAILTNLQAELVGNGGRFQLASLSAGDGNGGSLKAQGSLALGGAQGADAQLSATLSKFRIAARDEAVATASGTVSVAGPLTALAVTAPLTIDRAQINLPSSLPPSVVVLKVTEVNGANKPAAPSQGTAAPTLPATLDITLRLAGPVLVQGHGLDSQWSGRLKITGTDAAPKIAGSLTANRGSYALLGKSFVLTRGTIAFDGSAKIDPALDIVAEASAADITARVTIGGLASAPTVSLSSTPPLPRDEILARLLFGSGVRQMTPGQGLELAQAAAALSGGGPGLLDRLKGGLGLDWLRLGQGPAGAASSILNPSVVTPTTTSTTAVSAGKYIAPGVSVGVSQGVSPPTSKVTVEVDLGHHVTVDTEAGQNNGTGIGLNYNYDY
ncbi:MAG: translocation/assembly module TamB domain-containing protein [Stellaceae bacterium]